MSVARGSGNAQIARDLLDAGADPDMRCIHGRTADDYANEKGFAGVAAELASRRM